MEKFLMHPLYMYFTGPGICNCTSLIPDIESYVVLNPMTAIGNSIPLNDEVIQDKICRWVEHKGLHIMGGNVGIINIELKSVYVLDILAEDSRGNIVFIMLYPSIKRQNLSRKRLFKNFCCKLYLQTQEVFQCTPCIYAINIHSESKLATYKYEFAPEDT